MGACYCITQTKEYDRFKNIPKRTKKIVIGYLERSIYYSKLSIDLIDIIMKYYYVNFKFYTDQYGDNLKFINNHTVLKTKDTTNGMSLCVYGKEIKNEFYSSFSIFVQASSSKTAFGIGYVPSMNVIKEWNIELYNEPDHVFVALGSEGRLFYWTDGGVRNELLHDYTVESEFKKGDIFGLVFNFDTDDMTVYHNNIQVAKISLNNNKNIIPVIALVWGKVSVTVIHCDAY